jgi:Helix-turn-helix domain
MLRCVFWPLASHRESQDVPAELTNCDILLRRTHQLLPGQIGSSSQAAEIICGSQQVEGCARLRRPFCFKANFMPEESESLVSFQLRRGEPFNPFGLFNGIWIPETLVRANGTSLGAKIVYGRLTRYAGQHGRCYPSVPTLAAEVGLSVRQTQNYLRELERNGLIRRLPRYSRSGQTSNAYDFLWHELFEGGVKRTAPEGVQVTTPEGVKNIAPKESQIEESHSEEKNKDLDSPPANRKNRDSRPDGGDVRPPFKQYSRLREGLAEYMVTAEDPERVYPSDRLVVDVMDAAAGATEEEVIRCLHYLRNERGLMPGSRHGPRRFSWFKTVVGDYFQQKRFRETVFSPAPVSDPGKLSKKDFDSMTEAIEIDGASM